MIKKACVVFVCLVALFLGALSAFPPMQQSAWAIPLFGFSPQNYKNRYTYGQGVYFAPFDTKVYAEPREDAPLIEEFVWTHANQSSGMMSKVRHGTVLVDKVFVSYYPSLDLAMMAVVSENGDGWAEVIIDHAQQTTGWVKIIPSASGNPQEDTLPSHMGRYQTWQEFMKHNAKAAGVYWLNGVSSYNRQIRTSPEDAAKIIPITVIKKLSVKHVRGNWMLVEVKDFDNQNPIGWVRWRDDEGRLMVFTNFSGNYMPILSAF